MAVIDFIVNILSTPAILVGLLSLLGLCLQGKPIEDIVTGTIKTIVGFLVLEAGSAFLQSGSLLAFGEVFNYAFNTAGRCSKQRGCCFDGVGELWLQHSPYHVPGHDPQHRACTLFSYALHLPDWSPHAVYGLHACCSAFNRRS